ncbi:MAG: hypothetical protein HEQ22_05165 [Sphingopyxis sp.]|uniref:TcfC E-set like domain-containing protein n=1 Tax=Sphingopyxis sp. TaxID=1908224 RepID=UPI003D80CAF5
MKQAGSRSRLRPLLLLATCLGGSALLCAPAHAAIAYGQADDQQPGAPSPEDDVVVPQSTTFETEAPPGFGNLTAPVDTLFDTFYLGHRLGSFRAVLDNGFIAFSEPQKVAEALSGRIATDAVRRLLSAPQPINERYRCFPGQTANCGVMPPGEEGLIVDPERFFVELFFNPEDVILPPTDAIILGPASTGPSLIQTINFSAATAGGESSRVRFGATLDTAASIGQTALLARTIVDDQEGTRLLEATGQHVWDNRIVRAGLFEDFSTKLLSSYRLVGAEFGSFYPRKAYESSIATPIQIVLPREADVELRRKGALISVRHYAAGAQILDTSGLPEGSYPIDIVARSGGAIVFQDVRSFTKAQGLPLENKTEFSVRAGFYAPDTFIGNGVIRNEPFLPRLQNTPVVGARARRRVGQTSAIDVSLLHIDGGSFAEVNLTTIQGNLQGLVTAAVGDNGSYGALATGGLTIQNIRFSLTARYVKSELDGFQLANVGDYRPFARSEKSVFGTAQLPVLGGALSVSGGYTSFAAGQDDYSADIRYTRTIGVGSYRPLLSIYGRTSNRETRIGGTLSFLFGLDRRTNASVRGGAEYVPRARGQTREGFSPVLDATLSRSDRIAGADVVNQIGVSTNADTDRAFASTDVRASFGQFDATAQYQTIPGGSSFSSIFANGRTGFAFGGGKFKLGLADVGQAIILSDIAIDDDDLLLKDGTSDSGYRIKVNRQPFDRIKPGQTSAVGVAPYDEYEVELEAENAPPYDIDTSIQRVTLYPGNVAYFKYEARNAFALYGRVVDGDGKPQPNVTLRSGSDTTSSDTNGYFLLSVTRGEAIALDEIGGGSCKKIPVDALIEGQGRKKLYRVGDLACAVGAADTGDKPVADPAQAAPPAKKKTISDNRQADVVGVALAPDARPLEMAMGVVTSSDDADFGERMLFTNGTGRFGIAGLSPGKSYAVHFADAGVTLCLDVPRDATGLVDLGSERTVKCRS